MKTIKDYKIDEYWNEGYELLTDEDDAVKDNEYTERFKKQIQGEMYYVQQKILYTLVKYCEAMTIDMFKEGLTVETLKGECISTKTKRLSIKVTDEEPIITITTEAGAKFSIDNEGKPYLLDDVEDKALRYLLFRQLQEGIHKDFDKAFKRIAPSLYKLIPRDIKLKYTNSVCVISIS